MKTEREERVWDVAFVQELTRQQELAIRSGVAISIDIACAAADAAIESLRASGRLTSPTLAPPPPPPRPSPESGAPGATGTEVHFRPLVDQLRRVVEDARKAAPDDADEREKLWSRVQEVAELLGDALDRRDEREPSEE